MNCSTCQHATRCIVPMDTWWCPNCGTLLHLNVRDSLRQPEVPAITERMRPANDESVGAAFLKCQGDGSIT